MEAMASLPIDVELASAVGLYCSNFATASSSDKPVSFAFEPQSCVVIFSVVHAIVSKELAQMVFQLALVAQVELAEKMQVMQLVQLVQAMQH